MSPAARLLAVLALIALMLVALSATAAPARLEVECDPRDVIAEDLADAWGEAPVYRGIIDNGAAIAELFASPSGTWTFVLTRADGLACIVTSGMEWEALPLPAAEPS